MLITKADVIHVENLNIKGMSKNHHLSKSISDASFSEFFRKLEYKYNWYGKEFKKIDRFYPSSQMCSECGLMHSEMKNLSVRVLKCRCGNIMDRDANAAINIYRYGEELRNLTPINGGKTDVEMGDHGLDENLTQVPVEEASIITSLITALG